VEVAKRLSQIVCSDRDGIRGAFATRLACAAYLSAMRTWLRDDSPDLARTMAALDARLRRIEGWFRPARTTRSRDEPLLA